MIQRGCILYIILDDLSACLMQSPYTRNDTYHGVGFQFMYNFFFFKAEKSKRLPATLRYLCITVRMSNKDREKQKNVAYFVQHKSLNESIEYSEQSNCSFAAQLE